MKYLFAILVFVFSAFAKSDDFSKRYIGVWGSWSSAGMAFYASFRIDENYIAWAGHRDISPECKVRYKVIEHLTATSHQDIPAKRNDPEKNKNTVFDYFMIELEAAECSEFMYMLLPFPRTNAVFSDGIYNTYFVGYKKDGSKEPILVNVSKPK